MGGKNFEAGVYSYDKFKKKKMTFGYTYTFVTEKKKSEIKHGRLFFSFKNSISGFC